MLVHSIYRICLNISHFRNFCNFFIYKQYFTPKNVGMITIFSLTILHTPSTYGPLVIAIKPKTKEILLTAAVLLFYISQKHYFHKNCSRFQYLHYFRTLQLSGSSIAPNSQVLAFAIILSHVWRLYKTGIGLTTGFIGSQYS
jgi:hypothetical protein